MSRAEQEAEDSTRGRKEAQEVIEQCRKALAEELSAWDIDPPIQHVKDAHDACVRWLKKHGGQK